MVNYKEHAAVGAATKTELFFENNRKIILGVIVAIIVIAAAFFLYHTFVAVPRGEKASTALARGQEYFNAEQFDKALNGDGAGYAGLVKIADDYSSTEAGNLANLYAGLCYANLNMISPAAISALGNAYAHVGQVDKAISKLEEAAEKADSKAKDGVNNTIAPYFMLQAGELLESQNKVADANKVYQDIKKKYVNSALVQSSEIDKYIERTTK